MTQFLVNSPEDAKSLIAQHCVDPDIVKRAFCASYDDMFETVTSMLLAVEEVGQIDHVGVFCHSKAFYHVRRELSDALTVFQASPSKGYSGALFEHPFFAHITLPEEMIFVLGAGSEISYVAYGSFDLHHYRHDVDFNEWDVLSHYREG